jgi:hypothetical protein
MTFDYTRSIKAETAKKTKPEREARYLVQLFERQYEEEQTQEAELNRLRTRLAANDFYLF